ncbi:hypothetical protein ES703_16506 [subsurface metagenome]
MRKSYKIRFGNEEIKAKVIDMKNVHVIAPFFLACSHYNEEIIKYLSCDKNILHGDDRVCCDCGFYNGGDVLALDWGNGNEINFMHYPFKNQYSFDQIKTLIGLKGILNQR